MRLIGKLRDHLCRPSPKHRRRMIVEAWALIGLGFAVSAFAYLLPQDFHDTRPGYLRFALAAFLFRTFQFHVGILFWPILGGATYARRWVMSAAGAALIIFLWQSALLDWAPRRRLWLRPFAGNCNRGIREMACSSATRYYFSSSRS